MMRRVLALSLVAFTTLFACSRPNSNTENATANATTGPPVPGDWAIVRFEADADTLNPLTKATDPADRIIGGPNNSNVYESLLYTDPKDNRTFQGRLAVSRPDVSDDHLTYTFTVRDG